MTIRPVSRKSEAVQPRLVPVRSKFTIIIGTGVTPTINYSHGMRFRGAVPCRSVSGGRPFHHMPARI